MKIQLPDGERINLEENMSIEEKKQLVESMIEQWYPTIKKNWDSNMIRFFLDGLANYLVWHKEDEDKNKQDKDILSIKKVEQMEGKRKSTSIPFSSLNNTSKEKLFGEGRGNE